MSTQLSGPMSSAPTVLSRTQMRLLAAPTAKAGLLRASVDAVSPDNRTDKGLRNEVEAVQVHGYGHGLVPLAVSR